MAFTIVSFCGGGMRGLLSATILQRLWAIRPSILTATNVFAGTSTGSGIVSSILAKQSPYDIIQSFRNGERAFFKKQTGSGANEPAYDVRDVYAKYYAQHGDRTLGDFTQKLLFTAFDVGSTNRSWSPLLYNNFSNPTPNAKIATCVTQSSAMPGMMGAWERGIDGAFVNHDPSLAAISLAVASGVKLEDIVCINIGTGLMKMYLGAETNPQQWGAGQWENGGPHDNLGNLTPPFLINGSKSGVLDAALNGTSTSLASSMVQNLLGSERYACCNPALDWYIPENCTSEEDLDELVGKANLFNLVPAGHLLQRYWPASQ